mmetsp:Transcript_36317/g.82797  ORF Transcript_36317/g.82797 Transcript_36317/m.82797 type:complete len:824 (+) Transcript_36317:2351-4822(+)
MLYEHVHKRRQNFLECTGALVHDCLPHLEGSLLHSRVDVGPQHVQGSQQIVAPLLTQHLHDCLALGSRGDATVLVQVNVRGLQALPGCARDAEHDVAQQLHRALPDAPVVVHHAVLDSRQQQRQGSVGVVVDKCVAGQQSNFSDGLVLIGQTLEDCWQHDTDVTSKVTSQGRRQVDEQRQIALPDVLLRVRALRKQIGEQGLEELGVPTSQDFTQTLRSAGPLHSGALHLERVQQPLHDFAAERSVHARRESAQGTASGLSHLRRGVEQSLLERGEEAAEIVRDVLVVSHEVAHVRDDLSRALLNVSTALLEAALHDGHQESERRRVDGVHEGRRHHHLQRHCCLSVGVFESQQELRRQGENLGVANDGPDVLQGHLGALSHLDVGVSERGRQRRHDGGEAVAELAGGTVRHRAQQLDTRCLGAPRTVLQALQQRWHDKLDTLPAELCHHSSRSAVRSLSHRRLRVAAAVEQQRQNVDNVRLKQPAERVGQALEREERALAPPLRLLVAARALQLVHHVELLQRGDAEALHHTAEAVGSTAPVRVCFRGQELVQEARQELASVGLCEGHERGQAGGHGALHKLRGSAERCHQQLHHAVHLGVVSRQEARHRAEEDDDGLPHHVGRVRVARRPLQVLLEHNDQLLHLLLAVLVEQLEAGLSHVLAHVLIVVLERRVGQEVEDHREVSGSEHGCHCTEREADTRTSSDALRVPAGVGAVECKQLREGLDHNVFALAGLGERSKSSGDGGGSACAAADVGVAEQGQQRGHGPVAQLERVALPHGSGGLRHGGVRVMARREDKRDEFGVRRTVLGAEQGADRGKASA